MNFGVKVDMKSRYATSSYLRRQVSSVYRITWIPINVDPGMTVLF